MHPLDYIYKAMNIVMEDVGLQSKHNLIAINIYRP